MLYFSNFEIKNPKCFDKITMFFIIFRSIITLKVMILKTKKLTLNDTTVFKVSFSNLHFSP